MGWNHQLGEKWLNIWIFLASHDSWSSRDPEARGDACAQAGCLLSGKSDEKRFVEIQLEVGKSDPFHASRLRVEVSFKATKSSNIESNHGTTKIIVKFRGYIISCGIFPTTPLSFWWKISGSVAYGLLHLFAKSSSWISSDGTAGGTNISQQNSRFWYWLPLQHRHCKFDICERYLHSVLTMAGFIAESCWVLRFNYEDKFS